MKHSYFILFCDHLDYPLHVAFNDSKSVEYVREHHVLWDVVKRLTQLDRDSFFFFPCTQQTFINGLIKIDFTFK